MNDYNDSVPAYSEWTDCVEYVTLQGWPTTKEVAVVGCAKGALAVDTVDGLRCVRHLPTARTIVAIPGDTITTEEIKEVADEISAFIDGATIDGVGLTAYIKDNDLV